MYTEEELKKLSEEEDSLTEEAIAAILITLGITESELKKEIRNFYATYATDGVITYAEARKWVSAKNHTRRLFALNQIIDSLFQDAFSEFEKTFTDYLRKIILKEADFFGINLDVSKILDTAWGADGLTGLQRLLAHRSKWTSVIGNDLKISFLKRDNLADVLTQMAKRGESIDKVLARLLRTEASATSAIARKEIYDALGIKKYRFIHIDGCSCETCNDMHNQVFLISEYVVGVTANPLHPNCDDTTQPIVD